MNLIYNITLQELCHIDYRLWMNEWWYISLIFIWVPRSHIINVELRVIINDINKIICTLDMDKRYENTIFICIFFFFFKKNVVFICNIALGVML
jgi:hypothetical protein